MQHPPSSHPPRDGPYTPPIMGRKLKAPRPKQGARLAALRRAAGFTQAELARLIDVSHSNVAFWETSAKPPRSDVLPKMAAVLGVRVEDLLGPPTGPTSQHAPLATSSGPVGQVQRAFEAVRKLPRRQQLKLVEFVFAFVNEYKRKAS